MTVETEPSLAQLRALAAFVDHGSITAAADHLGIKRSTLWAQLKRMSEAMNVELTESIARDLVRPSPIAERLSGPARRMLLIADEVERVVAEGSRGLVHGRLTVAAYPAPIARFVARAVREFRAVEEWRQMAVYFDGLDDRFRESGGDVFVTMLLDGEVDIAIAPTTAGQRVQRVQQTPLYRAQLCAYDPAGMVVTPGKALEVKLLRNVPLLVAPRTSSSRKMLVELLRQDGCFPQFYVESPSVEALCGLAEAGEGVAILPDDALTDEAVQGGHVVPVASSAGDQKDVEYSSFRMRSVADRTLERPLRDLEDCILERAKAYDRRLDALVSRAGSRRRR